ncbi:MAG TPA: YaeQ family protein [Planctomycetota bacterium]|nr:YaeQ family protein [Planctomycetota bacterium]
MAHQATIYHFQIELSDVDRGVYETLDLRLAQHPSESMAYLLTRTIAYALLLEEGLAFSKGGLSSTDEPPLSVRDLQGTLRVWIEIGTPSADRLHKASKSSPRVVVFTQHHPRLLMREAGTRAIHKAEQIEVYALEPKFLNQLGELTDRNARWTLLRHDGMLYVTVGAKTVSGAVTKHALAASTTETQGN